VTLADLLIETIGALEAEGIAYMLTGSMASTFHGEPRATRDIDFVIDPTADGLDRLLDRLRSNGLYVDQDAARAALHDRGQFNAIAIDAKVDFIVRKDQPFARSEFERRQRVELPGIEAHVATVEDLILAKLAWARDTDSERQRRDVSGMIEVAAESLDRAYLARWADLLGLGDAWRRLDARAGESPSA
jgi:hypothetical protein